MFMQRILRGIACCLLAVAWVEPVIAADDPLQIQVKAIFAEGSLPGESAHKTASTHYEKAKAAGPKDVRPALAMTLVYLYHDELGKAADVLSEAAKENPDDPQLQRISLWLRVKRGEVPELVKVVSDAAARLQKLPNANEPAPSDVDAAKFLGRIVGYCAGPGGPRFAPMKLEEREKAIATSLSPKLKAAFLEGRESIAKKYAGIQDGSIPLDEFLDEGEVFNRPLKSEEPEQLRGKNSPERTLLEKQFDTTKTEYQRINQLMAAARQRFSVAEANMNARLQAAANEKNPRAVSSFKSDAQKFRDDARKDKLDYVNLSVERKRLNAEGLELRKKFLAVCDKEVVEIQKAEEKALKEKQEKEKDAKDKDGKGNATAEKEPAKPMPRRQPPRIDPVKLAALETYIPLDLEAERKQILASFGKP